MFIKNIRFRRFATHKLSNGNREWIYYDCQNNHFVTGVNRQWRSLGYVGTVAVGYMYDKFVSQYGDPYDAIFSPKVRLSLLILIPILDRIITFLVRHIRDNKADNFKYLSLSNDEAIKIYKKDFWEDIGEDLVVIIFLIGFIVCPPSGGRTACIYLAEDLLITSIPEYFEEKEIYKKALKAKEE